MNVLQDSLLELIRRTSAEIPDDVHKAILASLEREKKGTIAASAMKIIEQNIALAKNKSQPICQDTGSILFYVDCPVGFDQIAFEETAREAVKLATKKGYLRQNSVDSLTGKNDGTNVGPGLARRFISTSIARPEVSVRLVLKGGGCENVGAQYSLPNEKLKANRDLDGCRKAILDAVLQAQGKGCGPGILGVCIGGDRATGYEFSQAAVPAQARRPQPESRTRQAGAGHRGDGERTRHRPDGFRRQDHAAGREDRRAEPPAGVLFRQHQLHVLGLPPPGRDAGRRAARFRSGFTEQKLNCYDRTHHSLSPKQTIRALKVGDEVAITGTLFTGRDAVHKYLHEGGAAAAGVNFKGGILYHCGPVVIKDEQGNWKCVAAGPTTSIREEPYQWQVIRDFGLRGVIGKGGMGERTLEACKAARLRLSARGRRRGPGAGRVHQARAATSTSWRSSAPRKRSGNSKS